MDKFYSGYTSGITQVIIGYPLDTIIVYIQSEKNINNIKLKNIYKGVKYSLFTCGLISGLSFGINYNINKYINNYYISGGITGLLTSIVITPVELYKIRSQKLLSSKNINIFTGFKSYHT